MKYSFSDFIDFLIKHIWIVKTTYMEQYIYIKNISFKNLTDLPVHYQETQMLLWTG